MQSLLLNHNGTTRYGLLSQTFDYGITDHLTASVTEVYANAYERNAFNPAEGRIGFRSPKFQLSQWTSIQDQWTVKTSIGLQLNPSTHSKLNYGQVSADVMYRPLPAHVVVTGLIYTSHKDIGSHSHAWRSEWGSSWGFYHIRLKYTLGQLAGFGSTQGRFSPSDYASWELEVGRPLTSGLWGSLSYASERADYRWSQVPMNMPVSSINRLQRWSANLKWAWN